jgi:endogenous inhibitor of DNA gyrase (YacG/DUF329 family)
MAPYDHEHSGEGAGPADGPRCPICGKPATAANKPFCSKRCADVDLHRWLSGVYAVPTNETPEEEGEKEK